MRLHIDGMLIGNHAPRVLVRNDFYGTAEQKKNIIYTYISNR